MLRLGFSLKRCLALVPLLFLPYATTIQALSATTVKEINGNQPYLTFGNGVTKVTTTDGLLGITISDGTTQTTYTPANNTSTASNPIVLPVANQSFADIGMLVPANTNSISLSALIGAPYNYWGDDDGDGQGTNGITATGNLSVSITDKNGREVNRNTVLSACNGAPYKVQLTSTAGSLTTQYGVPNSSSFSGGTAIYYINPKAGPTICYARPNLKFGSNSEPGFAGYNFAGPTDIWNPTKGFLVQTYAPSEYYRNFPTIGANNLHFDLLVDGIDSSTLTWPAVTQGGITATMTLNPPVDDNFNPDGLSSVRVTLTGPAATTAQQSSDSPGSVTPPYLPQTFVLVAKDSSNREVLKYGFVLRHWFVSRGPGYYNFFSATSWCSKLGENYHLSEIKDLTNGVCSEYWCQEVVGATPPSTGDYYQRNIGAGLFAEWGAIKYYTTAGFGNQFHWTSNSHKQHEFIVSPYYGNITLGSSEDPKFKLNEVCTYP